MRAKNKYQERKANEESTKSKHNDDMAITVQII